MEGGTGGCVLQTRLMLVPARTRPMQTPGGAMRQSPIKGRQFLMPPSSCRLSIPLEAYWLAAPSGPQRPPRSPSSEPWPQ